MELDSRLDRWSGPRSSGQVPRTRKECGAKWVLVMCCEWCFKDSGKAARSALNCYAMEMGGVFRCFKMASQFLEWESKTTKPYFLITDWRTAKPCVESKIQQAVFTVVVCMDGRQERKANRWVSNLGTGRGLIHISATTNFEVTVPALLSTMMQSEQIKLGRQGSHKLQQTGLKYDGVQMQVSHKFQVLQAEDDGAKVHHCSNQILPKYADVPQALQMDLSICAVPATVWVGPAMNNPSDVVNQVWKSLRHPEQVEHFLKAAMPRHYED
mmetsp:Transcript_8626/g.16332  ORF Transcript_8626/g.16332 Transcript_8626/m.16332 type:complete len:269 (+) Transcript_8626:55-861(+)